MPRRKQTEASGSFTDQANSEGLANLFVEKSEPVVKKRGRKSTAEVAEATVKQGNYVIYRRWYCRARPNCKGSEVFTGWEQLLDHPHCPECGSDMFWHQWGRIKAGQ